VSRKPNLTSIAARSMIIKYIQRNYTLVPKNLSNISILSGILRTVFYLAIKKHYHTDPDEPGEDNENPEFTGGITIENITKQVNFIGLQLETAFEIGSVPSTRKKLGKDVASRILKILDLIKI
jgi:hypothetical protein